MRIGLAAYRFKNKDVEYNIRQMEKALKESQGKADLLCFGETFLQGFDSLCWDFQIDKDIAITQNSAVMQRICSLTVKYQTDLLFGYVEREGDTLFSSCAVVEQGKIIHNYRRISKNWKEYSRTDGHYREGTATDELLYHGRNIMIALCGDLWLFPERFKTDDLLIWPVYVNFDLEEWEAYEQDYADQALLASRQALMINSITDNPISHGNAFYFYDGKVKQKLGYDTEAVLIVEV